MGGCGWIYLTDLQQHISVQARYCAFFLGGFVISQNLASLLRQNWLECDGILRIYEMYLINEKNSIEKENASNLSHVPPDTFLLLKLT